MNERTPHARAAHSAPPAGSQEYPYPWVRLRSVSAGPFVYRRMVQEVGPGTKPGDLVAVYDRRDTLFGHGFYHDRSQIAVRLLSWDRAPVDDAFFAGRIARAVDLRRRLLGDRPDVDTCRLIHAEGDGLSGLIAEQYADWIAIEVFSLGIFNRLPLIRRLLSEQTGLSRFVVRADDRVERLEGFRVPPDASDEVPRTVTVVEHGVRFRVDLQGGHKTGFFCDQRDNRRRLADWCGGQHVLDVCCYTGGFGLYAMKLGGAASVTGVDLDEQAVALAQANAKLNETRIQHVHADAFAYLRQMQTNGRLFDVVVLDPPKFVPSREDFHEGARKYVDLNTLALSVLKPGGLLLTCSCSGLVSRDDFLGMVRSAAGRHQRPFQILDFTGAAPDHPVLSNCPEGAYLKALWARVW
ncbi:MAG: class I SAM-dependent rRNA methyltransferase [Phycisphaerae bacterium]|nr:class I SAM-dependent rRNA methyltransferase [Phycisphaerae bacterium]